MKNQKPLKEKTGNNFNSANGMPLTPPAAGWALLGNCCCKQRIPGEFVRITSQSQTSRLAPGVQRIAAVGEVWERSLGIPRMIAASRPALLSYWLPSGTASMRTGCLRLRLQNLLTVLRSRNRGLSLPRTSQARALLCPLCGLAKRPQQRSADRIPCSLRQGVARHESDTHGGVGKRQLALPTYCFPWAACRSSSSHLLPPSACAVLRHSTICRCYRPWASCGLHVPCSDRHCIPTELWSTWFGSS